jgi:hypothetical protein
VQLPKDIVDQKEERYLENLDTGIVEFHAENTHRDVVDSSGNAITGFIPKYGPSRFDPVLPGLRGRSKEVALVTNPTLDEREITWTVHADNAGPKTGKVKLNEISVVERLEE